MPVSFLSDEQREAYGRYIGAPPSDDLARHFHLDDTDRALIARKRGDHNRLGFAVPLGTVRYLGTFLEDPMAVPDAVLHTLRKQLSIENLGDVTVYGGGEQNDLFTPLTRFSVPLHLRPHFAFGHLPFASTFAAQLTSYFEAGASSFDRQLPLRLLQTCHDVEEEASGWRRGVDGIRKALELHTLFVKLAYEVDQMLYATAQSVELPDHKRISVAQRFLCFEKSRPFGPTAADPVFENFLATGFCKGVGLEFKVLIQSGDTSVSDQHEEPPVFSELIVPDADRQYHLRTIYENREVQHLGDSAFGA